MKDLENSDAHILNSVNVPFLVPGGESKNVDLI